MKYRIKYVADGIQRWLTTGSGSEFILVLNEIQATNFPTAEAARTAFHANGRDVRYPDNVEVLELPDPDPKKPWDQNWRIISELGEGGQGMTFKVASVSDPSTVGVLKLLKHNDEPQARARMNREVANLEALHVVGAKVPKVYESNTADFKSLNYALYFVMEFISGEPLSKLKEKTEAVPLETAVNITLDLCNTIKIAHAEDGGILHRDIKPANIIVRDLSKSDVVIVDYGLSVNKRDAKNTRQTETIKNEFLTLPEGSVDGEDRRDKRSDLAALCAILCYCFTKAYPRQLHDPQQRLPHRRAGNLLSEKIGSDRRVEWLNSFLDKGLAWNPDGRFQDVGEIIARLTSIRDGSGEQPKMTAKLAARQATDVLHRHDRKTQIANYATKAKPMFDALRKYHSENHNQLGEHFELTFGPAARNVPTIPADNEPLPHRLDIQVKFDGDRDGRIISYQIGARKSECTIYRLLSQKDGSQIHGNTWTPVFTYEGLQPPSEKVVVDDLDVTIGVCIQVFLRALKFPS